MKRVRLLVPLVLLALGLTACRRVSWQLVAEPLPERPLSEVQKSETPDASTFAGTATPSDAEVLEGHFVGTPRVATAPAGAATAVR